MSSHARVIMRVVFATLTVALGACTGASPCRPSGESVGDFAPACWMWTESRPGVDWFTRVRELSDGSVIAVGFIDRDIDGPSGWEAIAVRFDKRGRVLWSRIHGGEGNDAFWDVRELPGGQVALAGFSGPDTAGTALLVVLDRETGAPVRTHRFGARGSTRALGLTTTTDGGVVLAGEVTLRGAAARDAFLIRLDSVGSLVWERTFGGEGTDRAFFVERSDDGFVVAGVTGDPLAYDLLTFRVRGDGSLDWRSVVGGAGNDPNHGLAVHADGRIIVTGYTNSAPVEGANDLIALTYSQSGQLLRHEVLSAPGDDRVMAAIPDPDGSTWLVGYTTSLSAGGRDVLVARVDSTGAFEPWLATLGGTADDHAYGAALTARGELLIGGYSNALRDGRGPHDLLALRLDPRTLLRKTEGVSTRRVEP